MGGSAHNPYAMRVPPDSSLAIPLSTLRSSYMAVVKAFRVGAGAKSSENL